MEIGNDAKFECAPPVAAKQLLGVIPIDADCPPAANVKEPGTAGSAQWNPCQAMVSNGGSRPGANETVWVAVIGLLSMVV